MLYNVILMMNVKEIYKTTKQENITVIILDVVIKSYGGK